MGGVRGGGKNNVRASSSIADLFTTADECITAVLSAVLCVYSSS